MADSRTTVINGALMRIPRRAEIVDRETLADTFVDVGPLFAMLSSPDHQILYGRRGTGKTHALFYLAETVERAGDVAVYIDLRNIGSSGGLYADRGTSISYRGTQLLIDTLESIHEALLGYALESDESLGEPARDRLLTCLDGLAEASTSIEVVGDVERETRISESESPDTQIRLGSTSGLAILG